MVRTIAVGDESVPLLHVRRFATRIVDAVSGDDPYLSADIAFFPDWGHPWPLWGGAELEKLDLPEGLISRLEAWTRVWQEVLDPETEVKWPDPEVGRAWIVEGEDLVRQVRVAAEQVGLTVTSSFHEYAP
jgi:hypothetical protein